LKAHATASRVLFEVEDHGDGFPADRSARTARASTDRSSHGAGLDISRQAVEAMGGTLGFRDLPGAGCVVVIDLPRGIPEAGSNVLQRTDRVPGDD